MLWLTLRIRVFAEWPYIYDGDLDYERAYLREFVDAPGSVLVVAKAGAAIVGAAIGSPMLSQKPEFRAPFEARGLATDTLFYFGESVLLPAFRGRGIGHRFFDLREAQARSCGAAACAFAAVNRPADHPRRPPDYQPLDEFWRKRGYAPVNGFVTALEWKDHDDVQPTAKDMQFWMKRL
ncbi:MAG: GNAT family N-acetyltransferase [Novosphingobium sp.]